jgi:hypothetical protein
MSEAELHVLRARLLGGIRSKARRGELWMRLPVGLVTSTRRCASTRSQIKGRYGCCSRLCAHRLRHGDGEGVRAQG